MLQAVLLRLLSILRRQVRHEFVNLIVNDAINEPSCVLASEVASPAQLPSCCASDTRWHISLYQ